VVLSEGSTAEAIVASTAIPGAFSPIRYKDHYLADGAISSNTPIQVAVKKGARRLIILPTGHACATRRRGRAVANALHALTLLIARQLVIELEMLAPDIEYSWCRRYVTGGLALRFLAHRRSYRPRHSLHRRLGWPSTACSRARFRTRLRLHSH